MAWDNRYVAVLRSWGLGVALGAGLVLAAASLLVGDVYVDLPMLRDQIRILHVFPGLAALVLPVPLVDRTPSLTLMTMRSPAVLSLLRLGGVVLASLPVVAALLLVGWTLPAALVVIGFVGGAAVVCSLVGLWYWAPMLGLLVVWLQWGSREQAFTAGWLWLVADLAALVVGGGAYVAVETARVRLRVRTAGTSSESRRPADTIRP